MASITIIRYSNQICTEWFELGSARFEPSTTTPDLKQLWVAEEKSVDVINKYLKTYV